MVFKDIQKFHENKRKEEELKRELLKNQFIKCFFEIHSPDEIKKNIRASLKESYLPTFQVSYKLRSTLEEVDPQKYIEIMTDSEEDKYLLVDFDFHNIKSNLNNIEYLESSKIYKRVKKELGSDFHFKTEGRTEDGTITLEFCKDYKPFLSRFF